MKITAIVGDYYHKEDAIREALERAVSGIAGRNGIELRFAGADRLVEEVLSEEPDAVVLFKENRVNPADENVRLWMTEEIASSIVRYVERGGGWLAWHSGLASYPPDGAYVGMLRGHFEYHPKQHQLVRYTGVADSGLTEEGESFEILDEQYFVFCDRERTNVFLLSESVDGRSVAGWHHPFGQGRVCCLTPSHNREGLFHPGSLALLGRALEWCGVKS